MKWYNIYDPVQIRMKPNHTSITLQEIINLGRKIKEVFGTYDITGGHFSNPLEEEKIRKILLIISFETGPSTSMSISYICFICKNNWEEIFVCRFSSADKMKKKFKRRAKCPIKSKRTTTYKEIINTMKKELTGRKIS